jgi:hypothetical protein
MLLSAAENAAQAEIIHRLCACYRIPLTASLFINFRFSGSKTNGEKRDGHTQIGEYEEWIISAPRNDWLRFQNRNNNINIRMNSWDNILFYEDPRKSTKERKKKSGKKEPEMELSTRGRKRHNNPLHTLGNLAIFNTKSVRYLKTCLY